MALYNDGSIKLHERPGQGSGPRTIIATGARGAAVSMVANVLHGAGVPMGDIGDMVGFDDLGFEAELSSGDAVGAIAPRDTRHEVWGFKFPDLHELGDAGRLGLLRRPLIVAIWRDPLAVAGRRLKTRPQPESEAIGQACRDMAALFEFLSGAGVPCLLLSYEKALIRRAGFVDTLLAFCGLRVDAALRTRLIGAVEPSPIAYATRAPQRFEGHIDGVVGSHLYGWCIDGATHDPVWVSLVVDGVVLRSALAADFRADLEASGYRDGRCAFAFDIVEAGAGEDSVVEVRIEGKRASVQGGRLTVAAMRARLQGNAAA